MNLRKCKIVFLASLMCLMLLWVVNQGSAKPVKKEKTDTIQNQGQAQKSARQRRIEANKRLDKILEAGKDANNVKKALDVLAAEPVTQATSSKMVTQAITALAAPNPSPTGINPNVDFTKPNWANSPNIRKFQDSLPGLGKANANNLGQYIPVAVADTTMYPGSDYYEIGLKDHQEQMNTDLPVTQVRGYYQINTTNPDVSAAHYLGPLIIAQKDKPVRIKFVNQLGANGAGDLPLPVDTTVMGAGMGPLGMNAMPMNYTQNRADLHLHGGLTPWISDGTPHQWITPAGEMSPYKKGDSFQNVPDMVGTGPGKVPGNASDGMGTYFYPNQQSARLMFYHDHSYGITRLNVYAGEAAGYLITDQVEEDLISGTNVSGVFNTIVGGAKPVLPDLGGVYHNGIPLIIQDKTFVNDATTPTAAAVAAFPTTYTQTPKTATVDPLWTRYVANSKGGNLWIGHEYMTNENIYDDRGYNDMGRWDYGPWMIPPMVVRNNTLPSPTIIPEAFMDTAVVNGCAFPYLDVPASAVRFRILNACNDRMLNLQLYKADPAQLTEVKMVPATPNPLYLTWPKDGRDGGVPDPTTAGPTMYQIGNECGFLAKVADVPPQPIDFDYNRRSVTFGGVTSKSLLLPPAVRADIVVDFSAYAGQTLILYNDAPAPMPLFDTRYDYFTDGPDLTAIGGAPTIPPGWGPNTRTIMQIRVAATAGTAYNVQLLRDTLPKAFAAAQKQIIVPAANFNAAYGTNYTNIYANAVDETLNVTGITQSIARVVTELPGLGYTVAPTVNFYGGGVGGGTPGVGGTPGTVATATAYLNGVTGITLVTAGAGYTSAPTVTIAPPNVAGGIQATAAATVSGGVITVISIVNPGAGYTVAPLVTITGGGAVTQATAQATITLGTVGAIVVNNGGTGYIKAPRVYLTGGGTGASGAMAAAMLNGDMIMTGKNLVEGMDMEFGRMNAILGSTPNPLAPTVGAGPVIGGAFYIDPPTEILDSDVPVLWRISHIGVDSHSIHFHLFDVQVVNRVDWTNTVKPPYDDEVGWKETIRTNPFEDIIVALRPKHMIIPFTIPNSSRLLDPTGMGMFLPVAPPIGIPAVAQTTNVITNFGWEYVWHCHLLGHEENDMMRPVVFNVPANIYALLPPTNLTAGLQAGPQVSLAFNDNATIETGFVLERSDNGGAFATRATLPVRTGTGNVLFTDNTVVNGSTYTYRVKAIQGTVSSPYSNAVTITVSLPLAPSNLTATLTTTTSARLDWVDNANNETTFTIQRATNNQFTSGVTTYTATANTITFNNTGLTGTTTYYYHIRANNASGSSQWSNIASVRTSSPTAPSGLTATPSLPTAVPLTITLQWTDNSTVETGFTLQRATNSTFGLNLISFPIPANPAGGVTTYVDNNVVANTPYFYRVRSFNGAVTSTWSNTVSATITVQGTITIIDNGQTGTSSTGTWTVSGAANPYGADSLYGSTGSTYTWTFTPQVTGTYRVSMWWTALSTRYTAVPVRVWNGGTIANLTVNQTQNGGMWNILGQWTMTAGTSYKVTITVIPSTSPPSTCADAVRFERL